MKKATKKVIGLAGSIKVNKNLNDIDLAVTQAKQARFNKKPV